MPIELLAVIVAGGLGVAGTIGGVIVTTWLGAISARRRLDEEDARRWLADRRKSYASFLALSQSMLREIDDVAIYLPYHEPVKLPDADDVRIAEGLADYFARWDMHLQPALGDVQLLASSEVADLADRVSGALMEITAVVELRDVFVNYYPGWFRALDLLGVLRNSMRAELGLNDTIDLEFPRPPGWPWLDGLPSEEEYIRRQLDIPGRPPLTPVEMERLKKAGYRFQEPPANL